MIITDKVALGICIVIVYIILSVLIFTNTIQPNYWNITMFLGGALLGGCYQAFVPDITIFKFGDDVSETTTVITGIIDLQICNFPSQVIKILPEPTISNIFGPEINGNTIKGNMIKSMLDTQMSTSLTPPDRSDIKRTIRDNNIFAVSGTNDINFNQLALMLISDYYLIDNLSGYAKRTKELMQRSPIYTMSDYIKLAINDYDLANSHLDMIKTLVSNLELMVPEINTFINKNISPDSIRVNELIKLLAARLSPNDKRILVIAGMAYACDAVSDNYQAKRYTEFNTNVYTISRYTSIVRDILTDSVY